MIVLRLLCGISDGRHRLCGGSVNDVRFIDPYDSPTESRFILADCPKHGPVATTERRHESAKARGQQVLHLGRGWGFRRDDEELRVDGLVGRLALRRRSE